MCHKFLLMVLDSKSMLNILLFSIEEIFRGGVFNGDNFWN